jgi:hypothetical protein
VNDDVRAGRVQSTGDRGAEAFRAAGDEHAAAGEGRGGIHGASAIRAREPGVKIPEPARRVAYPAVGT